MESCGIDRHDHDAKLYFCACGAQVAIKLMKLQNSLSSMIVKINRRHVSEAELTDVWNEVDQTIRSLAKISEFFPELCQNLTMVAEFVREGLYPIALTRLNESFALFEAPRFDSTALSSLLTVRGTAGAIA